MPPEQHPHDAPPSEFPDLPMMRYTKQMRNESIDLVGGIAGA